MLETNHVEIDQAAKDAINAHLADGDYETPCEVIQAGLSLLEQRKAKLKTLREAIKDGEKSGASHPFDSEAFKNRMRKEYAPENA